MKLTIALDWTPNVIHAGMYLAHLKGYFPPDLSVEFISTDIDNYTKSPIERLADHEAHIALGPTEHLLKHRLLKEETFPVVAIATIMQEETSGFVTLVSSDIDRPAKLDGRTYAGYQTLLEENLLNSMIREDGGQGTINMITPPRLEIFEAFLRGEVDACWVFSPWEGVIAQYRDMALNTFHLTDYQVPYGYSPLIMTREEVVQEHTEDIRAFLKGAARGYQEVTQHPEAVARQLVEGIDHTNFEDVGFIIQTMHAIGPTLLDLEGRWGIMDRSRTENYIRWLVQHNLLKTETGRQLTAQAVPIDQLFVNQYLPQTS